jgi:protein tyrosine phosphatase (PTP) superfamily phosphohydrolase (DUF442 family)
VISPGRNIVRLTLRKFALGAVLACLAAVPALRGAEPAAPKLETASLGSTAAVHRFGTIWLASQPARDDFALARDLGVRTVVNLRKASELAWDEAAAVRALGVSYENPAFQSPEELTDAVFDGVRRELTDAEKQPLLLHCSTANRVGAIWLAHRMLDDGIPYDSALREAETVGLKNPALRDKARDYIERHRPLTPSKR